MNKQIRSLTKYTRRHTNVVSIGGVRIGGSYPIAVQSMTNIDTTDTLGCVAQIRRIYTAGCRIVRLAIPARRDAENLANIAKALSESGLREVALVADIHFTPEVAMISSEYVDKIRINPGNYRGGASAQFLEMLQRCRERGVALRIGVNHGSLAPHIVEKWGDTPRGMVESAMEFLKVCKRESFDQVVVSIKASNVRIMIYAYRLLVAQLEAHDMHYPLHLGVTEAGSDVDGRVKSAVGIGALLGDGIGDTIRVSLTEPPENEIPPAYLLVQHFKERAGHENIEPIEDISLYNPYEYSYRNSIAKGNVGGQNVPVLYHELDDDARSALNLGEIVVLRSTSSNPSAEWRAKILNMNHKGDKRPVILHRCYAENSLVELQIKAAADLGVLFIDGLADGIWLENISPDASQITPEKLDELSLSILQAARVRMSKTEFIACPGCGRTMFDLEATLERVKGRMSNLKGLKIAVMGCIVNGPGEMADADYGYVGEGAGRVTLYRAGEVVRRSIPESQAVEALVELISKDGHLGEE